MTTTHRGSRFHALPGSSIFGNKWQTFLFVFELSVAMSTSVVVPDCTPWNPLIEISPRETRGSDECGREDLNLQGVAPTRPST